LSNVRETREPIRIFLFVYGFMGFIIPWVAMGSNGIVCFGEWVGNKKFRKMGRGS
jgi:hypothetical protein